MQFRYDFMGDKLDLSRFKKQITQNLVLYPKITYSFYVLGYKIQANINTVDFSTNYIADVDFVINELQRDRDGEVHSFYAVKITEDLRFKEFPDLIKYYTPGALHGSFDSNSVDEITDILSGLIKIIYKINNLKAFL